MAINLREFGLLSADQLHDHIVSGRRENRSADWIGEHLLVYGPAEESQATHEDISADERPPAERTPCLFLEDAKPSITNFVTLLWNRLFSYPHAISHINAIIHGTPGSFSKARFDECLRSAATRFSKSGDLANTLLSARRLVRSFISSSWRPNKGEAFLHTTEAMSSITLQLNSVGEIIGANFNLLWLNDGGHLIDIHDGTTPTFNVMRNMAGWIQNSRRELDQRVFGYDLGFHVLDVDTDPRNAKDFDVDKSLLQALVDKDKFLPTFQLLASIFHLKRVQAGMDNDNKISIYNADGLVALSELLNIDINEFRYAVLTEYDKTNARVPIGIKNEDAVNQDIGRIAAALYRALVYSVIGAINERLSKKEAVASIELFDSPNIPLSDEITRADYDCFCKNIISDLLGYSLFQNKTQWTRKMMNNDGIENLPPDPTPPNDYLGFYFSQAKAPSLISILVQEKSKKNIQHMSKQIFNELKHNNRVVKPNSKNKKGEHLLGLQHFHENLIWYDLKSILSGANGVIPMNIPAVLATSNNPIVANWTTHSHFDKSLNCLIHNIFIVLGKLEAEKCIWLFCLGSTDSIDYSFGRQSLISLHLTDLFPEQMSDYSEVISHSLMLNRYHPIVHTYNPRLSSSAETSSSTLERLRISAYVGASCVYLKPRQFRKLEMQHKQYNEKVITCQRFSRGYIARRHFQMLREKAVEYRKEVCDVLRNLKSNARIFHGIQRDVVMSTVEDKDIDSLIGFMKGGDKERLRIHKGIWGVLYVVSRGHTLYKLNLMYDFYWIFGSREYQQTEHYHVNLLGLSSIQDKHRDIVESLGQGFYLRKSSKGNILIKRKTSESMNVWGVNADFRNCIAPSLKNGSLMLDEFETVFDISMYRTRIARAIHQNKVSSKAIETESVIPLTFGTQLEFTSLSEVPLCFVVIDYTIKDRLRHERFNKQIREEVNQLQRSNGTSETGETMNTKRQLRAKSRDLYSHEASIHSLLIRMDVASQSLKLDDVDNSQRRRKYKWAKMAYYERLLRERFD